MTKSGKKTLLKHNTASNPPPIPHDNSPSTEDYRKKNHRDKKI